MKKLYTVSNLSPTLSVKKSSREGKAVGTFVLTFIVFMLVSLVNLPTIQSIIPLNSIILILVLVFIGVMISSQIVILLSKDVREKARQASIMDGDNKKFSIDNVWSISTGGILPIETKLGETLTVKYTTECLIFKSLLSNAIERDEDTVNSHYASMGKFIDKIVENNFSVEIVTLKYDSTSDDIWEKELNNIATTNLGSKYKNIFTTLSNNLYETTVQRSNVTVNYFIIKSQYNSLCTLTELLSSLITVQSTSRSIFHAVDILEFKSLLERYYGVDIYLEDIQTYITDSIVTLGQTKLLKYSIDGINFITVNKEYSYKNELPTHRDLDGRIIDYKFREDYYNKKEINSYNIKDIDLYNDELV